jgi:UDP-N-acetylglucosamine 2-epimerase (non-hydrolysing)
LIVIDPIGYFDFITLINHAKLILTDSGGVQQEASIFNIPCLTLRRNTEWVETIETGKNKLVGVETEKIVNAATEILNNSKVYQKMVDAPSPFKKGASKRILDYLEKIFSTGTLKLPSSNFLKEGIPL